MAERHFAPEKAGGIFYGWVIVGAAFAVMFTGFGAVYAFAAFFESFESEFGASRGSISLIFSIAGFVYFLLGAVSGPIADRFGARGVTATGMVVLAAGLIASAFAQSMWQLYVAYGLGVGIGVGFSYVPSVGTVPRWFVRRRGIASGIAVSGIGFGTLAMPPAAALLIDALGWRGAYIALGIAALVVGGLAARFLEPSPSGRGLLPDGEQSSENADNAAPEWSRQGLSLREAVRTLPFWALFAAFVAISVGVFMPFVHIVPYSIDHGHGEAAGVFMLSMIGLGSAVGRFALGAPADLIGRKRTFGALYLIMTALFVWWLFAGATWELVAFSFLFGAAYGGFVGLAPAVIADYFGGRSLGGIIGSLYAAVGVGTLLGPSLAGVAYDMYGSYELPILVSMGTSLTAALIILVLEKPESWIARRSGARQG